MRCWLTRQLTQTPQSPAPEVQTPPPAINWERRLFWLIIAFFVLVVATVAPITYFACALLKQWATVDTH